MEVRQAHFWFYVKVTNYSAECQARLWVEVRRDPMSCGSKLPKLPHWSVVQALDYDSPNT